MGHATAPFHKPGCVAVTLRASPARQIAPWPELLRHGAAPNAYQAPGRRPAEDRQLEACWSDLRL